MRKIGKSGKSGMLIPVLLIGMFLIIGFLAIGYVKQSMTSTSSITNPTKCGDSTGILTISPRSALVGGVAPSSPTVTAGINGGVVTTSVTSGTTAFPVGAKIQVLVSKSDYIDKSFEFTMPCGGYTLDAPMEYSTSDNPAITIKDEDANTLTNSINGGSANLTAVNAGATVKFNAFFEGTSGEGTGNMIYVIEFPSGSSANITDVTMGNLKSVAVPSIYSSNNAGAKVVAFAIPDVKGAVEPSYKVIATLGTGKKLAGGVYTTVYDGQEFINADSTIANGVENSEGTAEYENTGSYNFVINA